MKLWTIFLSVLVACAALASAQTAGSKSVIGEVTAIDASSNQIKIKADDGNSIAVALSENTSYLRVPPGEKDLKKAAKIAFTEIAVGDRLLARGPAGADNSVTAKTIVVMTKADLAQKHERDRAEWQKRGTAGTVTALNADSKEITIDVHRRDAKPMVIEAAGAGFRRYASDSVHFADAKPSSFADVQVGDTVRALGDKNEDSTRFKAEEIVSGSFQTIAATVVSVNAAANEVVVTDLKTKKAVTIHTNPGTMLRRLEERTATFLARRMRPDAAPDAGAPNAGAAPNGRPTGAHPPEVQPAAPNPPGANGQLPGAGAAGGRPSGAGGPGPGGFGGPGGPGGFRGAGGAFDMQQLLDRSPQLTLADLKKGDALIISSSKGADGASVTAFSLVAGVEPFLAAAPRTAGQVDLGSWSLSVGAPEQ